VFHAFGALSGFERNLIRERTHAGLTAARARGRTGGRAKSLDARQKSLAVDLYRQRKHTVAEISRTAGISKPTLYACVREAGINAFGPDSGLLRIPRADCQRERLCLQILLALPAVQ
jgi:DNA invertase Pin-like site-specific DNA recombinase